MEMCGAVKAPLQKNPTLPGSLTGRLNEHHTTHIDLSHLLFKSLVHRLICSKYSKFLNEHTLQVTVCILTIQSHLIFL